jgi:mannan endo-1,4-beta-mannosidase
MKQPGLYMLAVLVGAQLLLGCAGSYRPIDKQATRETRNLYKNLAKLSKDHTLFGHQHPTEYGHGWMGEEGRSDVKSVTFTSGCYWC